MGWTVAWGRDGAHPLGPRRDRKPTVYSYLLTIAYHGASYAGWQRQEGFDTVQERMEAACQLLAGEHVDVHGAGRTDRGVHARAQCAHVRMPKQFEPELLRRALNGNLPPDIAVRFVRPVPAMFHARFSAAGKRYAYRFLVNRTRPVFGRELFQWVRQPLDLGAMRRGAACLVGEHDFQSFANNPGYERTRGTVRTIRRLHLFRRPWGVDLVVEGNGFLYNQVRAIAGTLQDVGTGRFRWEQVAEMLRAQDRRAAGPNAPPEGLHLVRVLYPREVLGDGPTTPPLGGRAIFTDG